jgi:hypothetical protein
MGRESHRVGIKVETVPIGLVGKEMQSLESDLQPFSGFKRTIGASVPILWPEKKRKTGLSRGEIGWACTKSRDARTAASTPPCDSGIGSPARREEAAARLPPHGRAA